MTFVFTLLLGLLGLGLCYIGLPMLFCSGMLMMNAWGRHHRLKP